MMLSRGIGVLAVCSLVGCMTTSHVTERVPSSEAKSQAVPSLARLVDSRIGTAHSLSVPSGAASEKMGNTQPTGVVPFGMVQLGPDTDHPGPGSYQYSDDRISGFSFSHLSGAGCKSTVDFSMLPLDPSGSLGQASRFRHENEIAQAGSYSVKFDNGISSDLTTTARTGFARFTFPDSMNPQIAIKHSGDLHFTDSHHFAGSVSGGNFCGTKNQFTLFFSGELDQSLVSSQTKKKKFEILVFEPKTSRVLQVKVGFSFVSASNAKANLSAENKTWNFDAVKLEAETAWNKVLGQARVENQTRDTGTESDERVFYTALYHSLLHPNIFSDVDGSYRGFDQKIHNVNEHPGQRIQYANFSGWDIYRSQIQLLAFLFPTRTSDIVQSLINEARECGALPIWPNNSTETGVMVGDPSSLIIANAYAFGARKFETQLALDLMKKNGSTPGLKCNEHETRPQLSLYLQYGFVPRDISFLKENSQSVSITEEYATADFAISQYAKSLGDEPAFRQFLKQSGSWENVFDSTTGYLRPRYRDHSWLEPFTMSATTGFTEGNSAQYTWMIPFDTESLIQKIGGPRAVESRLNSFFERLNAYHRGPYSWIGNEPGFNAPWLYNWIGAPDLTQSVVSRIMKEDFTDQASGLPGNDDLGATSSWYVWSALGLYPAIPGVGGFTLGKPHFSRIDLDIENGKTLSIEASPGDVIQSVSVNKNPWTRNWIPYSQLHSGGVIRFNLGSKPNGWGTSQLDLPPSKRDFIN